MWITVVALLGAVCQSIFAEQTTIRVPPIKPEADSYVCTSVPIDEAEHYITGFKAEVGESHNAHHILLFGCDEPGSSEIIWDCGEMSPLAGEGLDQAPTCASSPNILYAWAHDAPELTLPEGVAFRVGGNTKIQYLVMQVHYMKQQDQEDTSGVTLTHTKEPQSKTAATMLLVTGGVVPPKSTESFETACVIDESVELHPFAYRTHTHKHGVDVSGWIVQENEKGDDMWTLIGRRDPQLPQMFVPVSNQSIVIRQGDLLAARCILKNDENREITIGPTGSDEMCNFYIMYWADSDKVLQDNTCFSPGAPYYYWSSEANLNHIPL